MILEKLKHLTLLNDEFAVEWGREFEEWASRGGFDGLGLKFVEQVVECLEQAKLECEGYKKTISELKERIFRIEAENKEKQLIHQHFWQELKSTGAEYILERERSQSIGNRFSDAQTEEIIASLKNQVENLKIQLNQRDLQLIQLRGSHVVELSTIESQMETLKTQLKELRTENANYKAYAARFGLDSKPSNKAQGIFTEDNIVSKFLPIDRLRTTLLSFLEVPDLLHFSHTSKLARHQCLIQSNFFAHMAASLRQNPSHLQLFHKTPEIEAAKALLESEVTDKETLKVQVRRFLQYNYSPTKYVIGEVKTSLDKLQKYDKKADVAKANSVFGGKFVEKLKSNFGKLDLPGLGRKSFAASVFEPKFLEDVGKVYKEALCLSDQVCLEKLRTLAFDPRQAIESPQEYETKQNGVFSQKMDEKANSFSQSLFEVFDDLTESLVIRGQWGEVCAAADQGVRKIALFAENRACELSAVRTGKKSVIRRIPAQSARIEEAHRRGD